MTPRHSNGPDSTRALPPLGTGETPAVSTAPPAGLRRRWWSAVPHHLGRARTSTVVLVVLFLAIGTLYLYVRPESTASTSVNPAGGTSVPAPETSAPAAPTRTTAPTETTQPSESAEPTTESRAPTTTPSRSPSRSATPSEEAPEQAPPATTQEEPTTTPEEPAPSELPLTSAPTAPDTTGP